MNDSTNGLRIIHKKVKQKPFGIAGRFFLIEIK